MNYGERIGLRINKVSSRALLRRLALDALWGFQEIGSAPRVTVNRVHLIYLHHVLPREESNFFRSLDWMKQAGMHFIPYSEAIDRIEKGLFDKPYVAFSFDDGLKSCVVASRILDQFDAKACFFVNGKIVGELDHDKRAKFCSERLNMPLTAFMDLEDLQDLKIRGHEIGNHTFSHLNSAGVPFEVFKKDFDINHELLEAKLGESVHFAWPYGRGDHITRECISYVMESGYRSCASAIRGCHKEKLDLSKHYVLRDHWVAGWPQRHLKYFLRNSVRSAL